MPQLGRSAGLTGFVDLARKEGVDAFALATAVGLPPDALADPDLQVSARLIGRIYELAAQQSGAEDFALRVAETWRISHLGAVGLVIREQPTVRRAIAAYARYQWLQSEAYAVALDEFADQAVLRIQGPPWGQRQAQELTVAIVVRTLKSLLGEAWKPLEVRFTHAAPKTLDSHRRILGVTPLFDQDSAGLVMRTRDLDAAIPTADPEMARQITAYLEHMTEARRANLRDRVEELVATLLPDGACSVDRVAQRLGMDRRTLHRRLTAEGATFSSILDATRRDLAVTLLTTSDRPLLNVSDLLGFSSLSAFAHWFRRKFGQSASAYRAAQLRRTARAAPCLTPVA